MVVAQGDVFWAELGEPAGSERGLRRPVLVVQGNAFNRSKLATVVCVALTSNTRWAEAPGNVLLRARETGLPRDSVANVSQVVTLDRAVLEERAGHLPRAKLELVLAGIDSMLGRWRFSYGTRRYALTAGLGHGSGWSRWALGLLPSRRKGSATHPDALRTVLETGREAAVLARGSLFEGHAGPRASSRTYRAWSVRALQATSFNSPDDLRVGPGSPGLPAWPLAGPLAASAQQAPSPSSR